MNREVDFFHQIAPQIIELVQKELTNDLEVVQKGHSSDLATKIDVAVERLIVANIERDFPSDQILAEEEYSENSVGPGRLWMIDPICGTANMARGMSIFCSDIALAIDGKLVAALVVDLMDMKYYWSVGGGKIWCGETEYQIPAEVPGTMVDIDLGVTIKSTLAEKMRHLEGLTYLQQNTDYMLFSLNTSLNLLYLALHKIDGLYIMRTPPWDVAAGTFLAQQTGVIVRRPDGSDFTLDPHSYLVAGKSPEIVDVLTKAFVL